VGFVSKYDYVIVYKVIKNKSVFLVFVQPVIEQLRTEEHKVDGVTATISNATNCPYVNVLPVDFYALRVEQILFKLVVSKVSDGLFDDIISVHQEQEVAVAFFIQIQYDRRHYQRFTRSSCHIEQQVFSTRPIVVVEPYKVLQGVFLVLTQLLYNRLNEDKENGLIFDDFVDNDVVILADEAHSLNVETRKKTKSEADEVKNWETAVLSAVKAREENMLIEFTATVDLANQAIHEKYEDKIVHRYDFLAFNKDGYSKDVKFLYNQEVHTEDQKRLLIINAVALSEYRRLLAERVMGITISPIVLIKSVKIAQSEEDRKFFDNVIGSLRPEDLNRLKELGRENKNREHEILADMFKWLASKEAGLISGGDWDGLKAFTAEIRSSFAHDNTLIYNSQKKEKADLLPLLDSPRNTIRAIFSVNALNEGWDVLGLYDIIHFDISESKKVSLQDIQLIGRGARYNPYELPRSYKRDSEEDNMLSLFATRNLEFDKYKRKFDNDPYDKGRVLETFVYHFVKTGTFLESLQRDLLGEGIISEGVEKKTITMKQKFLESETYQKGFVLVNQTVKRIIVGKTRPYFSRKRLQAVPITT
jgi:type III restriction enzyme